MSDVLSSPRTTPDAGAGFAVPPARPLGAADLRLMAAWASDHPATELVFASGGTEADPRITRVPPGSDAGEGVVVVPAGGAARLGQLLALTAEVNGTRGETDALRWSAAFWSESSVEKFLLPYLASLAGGRAYRVLGDVDRAWNGYPADRQPFALLHAGACPEGAPLDLGELVHVWYLDTTGAAPALSVSSLRDFLPHCMPPAPLAPAEVTAPYLPGELRAADPRLPTARQLRRMGEWASEFRTDPRYFSFDVRDGRYEGDLAALPQDRADRVVIPVLTPATRPDRPVPAWMTLQPLSGDPLALDRGQGDAAFWRTGAVEHLMIPYYASVWGGEALWMLGRIFTAWDGSLEDGTEWGPVSALIHLPKSDWEEDFDYPLGPGPVIPPEGGDGTDGPAVGAFLPTGGPGGTRLARFSARP
jgi:hypothetical protein